MRALELSDQELRDAAMAARAAAERAQNGAKTERNPRISAALAAEGLRFASLAARFEQALRSGT